MNVTSKDFTAQFKGIKAEVLALKQAHEYGLGRVDLPTETLIFTTPDYSEIVLPGYLYITLTFENATIQPIIQIFESYDYLFREMILISYNDGVAVLKSEGHLYRNSDYCYVFATTNPIKSIEWSIE